MKFKTNLKILLLFFQIAFLFIPLGAKSAPMSTDEINNFLVSKNSWLANYIIPEYISTPYPVPNAEGNDSVLAYVDARQAFHDTFYNKTVAQLINEEAIQHNINPQLVLTILQRESSSITQSAPSSTTRQAWPMFYMYNERVKDCLSADYLDGKGDVTQCNDIDWPKNIGSADYRQRAYDFGGVGQQIAYATAQLRNIHDNYCSNLTVSVDKNDLTVSNAASCALYTYTPHAASYDTGSTFYQRWAEWWGGTPNGGAYSAATIISEENFQYSTPSNPPTPPPRKAGDANDDGQPVGIADLSMLADQWGKNVTFNTGADFTGDGLVNIADLSVLADNWGR